MVAGLSGQPVVIKVMPLFVKGTSKYGGQIVYL
jgi:hypothetical protein